VFTVCGARTVTFFVTQVDRATQHVRAVLVNVVVLIAAVVLISRRADVDVHEPCSPIVIATQPLQVPLMEPPVVLAPLVLNLLLALAPPVVAFVFSPPPVVLTLTPRSLFPAPPVFAVASRPGAIASSIIRAIDSARTGAVVSTGSISVAPIAI